MFDNIRKFLILRKPGSGCLEGRTALLHPTNHSFTPAAEAATAAVSKDARRRPSQFANSWPASPRNPYREKPGSTSSLIQTRSSAGSFSRAPGRAVRRAVVNSCALIDNTATVHPPNFEREIGLPVLVSVSRKSLLRAVTSRPAASEIGPATLAAELYAAAAGAVFIRIHDPAALRDRLKTVAALQAAALTY